MKKFIATLISSTLLFSLFTACGQDSVSLETESTSTEISESQNEPTTNPQVDVTLNTDKFTPLFTECIALLQKLNNSELSADSKAELEKIKSENFELLNELNKNEKTQDEIDKHTEELKTFVEKLKNIAKNNNISTDGISKDELEKAFLNQ